MFHDLLVDPLGKNARTGSLTHPSRAGEQQCLGQVVVFDRILKGIGNGLLPHNLVEGLGSVFARRNDELFHRRAIVQKYKLHRLITTKFGETSRYPPIFFQQFEVGWICLDGHFSVDLDQFQNALL